MAWRPWPLQSLTLHQNSAPANVSERACPRAGRALKVARACPGATGGLDMAAWACAGATCALEMPARACPSAVRSPRMVIGPALVPPERSIAAQACLGAARALESPLGSALVPPQRSRFPLWHFLPRRLEVCVRSCIRIVVRRSLLGATKLCCTTLCYGKLAHG